MWVKPMSKEEASDMIDAADHIYLKVHPSVTLEKCDCYVEIQGWVAREMLGFDWTNLDHWVFENGYALWIGRED